MFKRLFLLFLILCALPLVAVAQPSPASSPTPFVDVIGVVIVCHPATGLQRELCVERESLDRAQQVILQQLLDRIGRRFNQPARFIAKITLSFRRHVIPVLPGGAIGSDWEANLMITFGDGRVSRHVGRDLTPHGAFSSAYVHSLFGR